MILLLNLQVAADQILLKKNQLEVNVLSKYKPAQLDESQISEKVSSAITESGATSMQDMGKVMGILKKFYPSWNS